MTKYKLINRDRTTRKGCENETTWPIGVWRKATGTGGLCTDGLLHCYDDPYLALFLNPLHADLDDPIVCEVEVSGKTESEGQMKRGYKRMRVLRDLDIPTPTQDQRVEFAIWCGLLAWDSDNFTGWAVRWLSGKNRGVAEARAARVEAEARAAEAAATARAARAEAGAVETRVAEARAARAVAEAAGAQTEAEAAWAAEAAAEAEADWVAEAAAEAAAEVAEARAAARAAEAAARAAAEAAEAQTEAEAAEAAETWVAWAARAAEAADFRLAAVARFVMGAD